MLGWTEVQQEENKGGFFGGANNVLALVALVLFADLALFGCVPPLPLLQLLPCTAAVALFVCLWQRQSVVLAPPTPTPLLLTLCRYEYVHVLLTGAPAALGQ